MCLYPTLIKNRKYTSNKKNGGNPPPLIDKRTEYVPIGCQQCIECRKKKAREWQVRLTNHVLTNRNGIFITLTFSNESIQKLHKYTIEQIDKEIEKAKTHYEREKLDLKKEGYELDNEIATKSIRLWLERIRKKTKKSIHHWLITEIGHEGTQNVHLHGIIWTENTKEILNLWQYGYIWQGTYVNSKTVNYIIKYITKQDLQHQNFKPKILTSKGIGSNYINTPQAKENKYKEPGTREYYRNNNGTKIGLPIYYRNKIYTEEEREKLWLQQLDKQTRYVLGTKIDISKNLNEYMATLKTAQEKNKKLGYGDAKSKWERLEYEKQLRELNLQKRLKNEANISLRQRGS